MPRGAGSIRFVLALLACLMAGLIVAACGGDSDDGASAPAATSPSAQEVIEEEFPDDEEQKAAAAVRKFYGVLGNSPTPKQVGIGCVVDGKLYDAGGDCEGFKMLEMAPEICQLLSKEAIDENFQNLYANGFPSNPPIGIDKTDDPKDHPQRLACLQGMGIFLRRVESDQGFKKAASARVVGVKLKGGSGKVKVRFFNGRTTTIDVVKQKGEWKFARLAGRVGGADQLGGADPTAQPPILPIQ